MKKVFAIAAIAALTACGGASTGAKTDTTVATVDTTKVVTVDTTKVVTVDTTKAATVAPAKAKK